MKRVLARRCAATFLGATMLGISACSSPASDGPAIVFAAASLSKPFQELAETSQDSVEFSFDGSNSLVDQIVGGAPADVFASADTANMDRAVEEGVIAEEPIRFATNTLVLVTPPGNPADVTGLDASLDGAKLVICAPEVPCGRATAGLAGTLGVTLAPVSEEGSVTDVLGKVTSGEADAGLVYATDASGAGSRVETIQVPGADRHVNDYWIAPVVGGDANRAAVFIDLVTGPRGQDVLASHGFGPA